MYSTDLKKALVEGWLAILEHGNPDDLVITVRFLPFQWVVTVPPGAGDPPDPPEQTPSEHPQHP